MPAQLSYAVRARLQERVQHALRDRHPRRPQLRTQCFEPPVRGPGVSRVPGPLRAQHVQGRRAGLAVAGEVPGPGGDLVGQGGAGQPPGQLAQVGEGGAQPLGRRRVTGAARGGPPAPELLQQRPQIRRVRAAEHRGGRVAGEDGERLLAPAVAAGQVGDRGPPGFLGAVLTRVPGEVSGREEGDARRLGLLHRVGEQRGGPGGHGGLPALVGAEEKPLGGVVVDGVVVHRHQRVREHLPRLGELTARDGAGHHADAGPRHLDAVVQLPRELPPVRGRAVLVVLGGHQGQRGRVRVPQRQMPGDRVGHVRVGAGGRLGSGAEPLGVRPAVPLAVADVLELHLEGAEAQRPHGVQLAGQRAQVVVGGEAHRLSGRDGPAEGDVVARAPARPARGTRRAARPGTARSSGPAGTGRRRARTGTG
ncbi:hypothetical protein STENM223S_04262 [Streptomyces tendae]